jgi:hypothetical protein
MHIQHGGIRVFAMARSGKGGYYIFTEYGVAIDAELKSSRASLLMVPSEFQPAWLEGGL